MNRTILTTVSDDRFGRKEGGYKATQDKITKIIEGNPHLGITHKPWIYEDFAVFMAANPPFNALMLQKDPAKNGRVYKPAAIYNDLLGLNDGDFLIYNDCSPEMWEMPEDHKITDLYSLHIIKGLCVHNGGILAPFVRWSDEYNIKRNNLGKHTHKNFTLDRCIKKMGMWPRREDYMCASGMIVIQKSDKTMEIVEEWLKWNMDFECCSFGLPMDDNDYSYWLQESHEEFGKAGYKMGHRHDQSILSLLLTHYRFLFVDIPTVFEGSPYNFLQYCRMSEKYEWIQGRVDAGFEVLQTVVNENGIELTVFDRRWTQAGWIYKVGKSSGSCHETSGKYLKAK